MSASTHAPADPASCYRAIENLIATTGSGASRSGASGSIWPAT